MKKIFSVLVIFVMLFALTGCASTWYYEEDKYTGSIMSNDADLRYERGCYGEMYEEFKRLDKFAMDQFGYTARVTENNGYTPVAMTGELFIDYYSFENLINSNGGYYTEYVNYLAPKSYTYSFLTAQQADEAFNAYYNMVADKTYYEIEGVLGSDFNGNPVEFYMQTYNQNKPFDIMILRKDVDSKEVTVAFAPEYSPYRYEVDTVMDNVNIMGLTPFAFVGVVCGSLILIFALCVTLFIIIKKAKRK